MNSAPSDPGVPTPPRSTQSADIARTDAERVVANLRAPVDRYDGFDVEWIDRQVMVNRLRIILSGGRA